MSIITVEEARKRSEEAKVQILETLFEELVENIERRSSLGFRNAGIELVACGRTHRDRKKLCREWGAKLPGFKMHRFGGLGGMPSIMVSW